jgi:hypothetical protein
MAVDHFLDSERTSDTMQKKLRKLASLAGAIVGVLAMNMAAPAHAGLVIKLSTDGVNWTTAASASSGGSTSYTNANFHGFGITVLGSDSNSPGTSSLTYLEGSAVHITNNTGKISSLYITLGDTGFTAPTNPPAILLDSQIGGSVTVTGAHNTVVYQSHVDPANGQNSLAGFTTGTQTPNITGTPKSYNDDTATLITNGLAGPYSITEYFKFTLDNHSQLGFQSSTYLSAVPEPSSVVLSCISVLGLVGYTWRRKSATARARRAEGRTDARK